MRMSFHTDVEPGEFLEDCSNSKNSIILLYINGESKMLKMFYKIGGQYIFLPQSVYNNFY